METNENSNYVATLAEVASDQGIAALHAALSLAGKQDRATIALRYASTAVGAFSAVIAADWEDERPGQKMSQDDANAATLGFLTAALLPKRDEGGSH